MGRVIARLRRNYEKIITSDIDADSIVEMIYIWIQQMKDKGITNGKNRESDNDKYVYGV